MLSDTTRDHILCSKAQFEAIPWLAHASEPHTSAVVAADFVEAFDTWGMAMNAVWGKQSRALEKKARRTIGDSGIDLIFADIAQTIHDNVFQSIEQYFARQEQRVFNFDETGVNSGLVPEVIDQIKRDMAWMTIEQIIGEPGFFSSLFAWYQQGALAMFMAGQLPKWNDGDFVAANCVAHQLLPKLPF